MGLLTTADGRVRLGWRLLVFLVVAILVFTMFLAVTPGGLVAGSGAILAGSLAGGWAVLAFDGRGANALGFHLSTEAPGELLKGVGLGIAIGLAVVVVMAVLGGVRWTSQDGNVGAWFSGALGALAFLAIPAAAEEALFRGYPFQAIGEAWGAGVAVVLTSIGFGLVHLANPGVTHLSTVNIVAAGMLLAVVYVRTLSLWWATGAHLGWNWAHGFLVDVPVSGLELVDAPLYEGVARGPAWLGGGPFGPEGSVVTSVIVLGATAALWWGPWLRPGRAAAAAEPLMGDVDTVEV